MSKYPTCTALNEVGTEYRAIRQFLEWLQTEQIFLATYVKGRHYPVSLGKSDDELALKFLEIDPVALEEDRREMLADFSNQ